MRKTIKKEFRGAKDLDKGTPCWSDGCDGIMILRLPRPEQTWKPFYGCSRFPKCNNVEYAHLVGSKEYMIGKPESHYGDEPDAWEVMYYDGIDGM